MESTPRDRFEAAVKVIQTLPKNVRDVIRLGSFQASHSLMLKFYGYYKQATTGPCDVARPAFYDVIGKAKWDSWNRLGDMNSEEAMVAYVDELKKIIETMPATQMVTDFIGKLGDFYELVDENISHDYNRLKPLLHRNRDEAGENFVNGELSDSQEGSPHHSTDLDSLDEDTSGDQAISQSEDSSGPLVNGTGTTGPLASDDDSDADEFCDTMDTPVVQWEKLNGTDQVETEPDYVHHNGHAHKMADGPQPVKASMTRDTSSSNFMMGPSQLSDRNFSTSDFMAMERAEDAMDAMVTRGGGEVSGKGNLHKSLATASSSSHVTGPSRGGAGGSRQGQQAVETFRGAGVDDQITVALTRLQHDMNQVLTRLEKLEALAKGSDKKARHTSVLPLWWPFPRSMPKTVFYLIVWPLIVNWIFRFLRNRRSHGH